jgi:hypothetical protein
MASADGVDADGVDLMTGADVTGDAFATSIRRWDGQPQPGTSAVQLLDAVPAMHDAVPVDDRHLARKALLAAACSFEPGPLTVRADMPGNPFAIVIVTGAVLRETHLAGRAAGELLGATDIVETHPEDDPSTLATQTRYIAHLPTTVAILDDRFRLAARRWPGLHQVISDQHARQGRRASRHLAALALPRVEDRVLALFADLADRWGRVTPDGIRIDLPLTHTLIGTLAAARRPTISLALAELAATGSLTRQADRSWLLSRNVAAAA